MLNGIGVSTGSVLVTAMVALMGGAGARSWLQDRAAVLDAVGSTAVPILGMFTFDIGALAVHFGARVMATGNRARFSCPTRCTASLMGSRHSFAERGIYELKGVPGKWPLDAVQG
jgi:hypothetical protein